MKKFILGILFCGLSFAAQANMNGNGFYRVMNYGSSRWASLIDDHATVDFFAGSADLHSLELSNDTEAMLSDPGSIVYINNVSGNQYNVAAQGVTLADLVDNPVSIRAGGTNNGENLYYIYGTYKGNTKYIGDGNLMTDDEFGYASLNVYYTQFKQWIITPVDANSDNYYGVVPNVKTSNDLYTTVYTSFSYQPYSSGVKAYYISRIWKGMAEMVEINGIIPAACPVVIKCAGAKPSDNKMQVLTDNVALPVNALKGVYFDFQNKSITNQVKYDPKIMRILGTCADGSLGFVTSDINYIPANTAYLQVPEGSPAEIKCVTTSEFEAGVEEIAYDASSLRYSNNIITSEGSSKIVVMNMEGKTMLQSTDGKLDVSPLPKGLYIAVSGGKSIKIFR